MPRRVPDQDVARLRRLLEPRGDVDGIAGCKCAALTRHDLARADSDAYLQLRPELALQVCVQDSELFAQLVARTCSAQGIVLVHDRDPEDRHHSVADELLHGAAVPLQHSTCKREVALHDAAQRLRVKSLPERGRAGDIAEEDGDRLPHLSRGSGFFERCTARRAEAESLRVLRAAARTPTHLTSVTCRAVAIRGR